jgi:gliding motility-associated protein GldE
LDPDPEPALFIPLNVILLGQSIWTQSGNVILSAVILVVALSISFLASGSEVAFFGLSRSEKEEYRDAGTAATRKIWLMISQPKELLATILIINNFVNVIAVLISAYLLSYFFDLPTWLEITFITSALLFFGEIFPKIFASRNRILMVRKLAPPLYLLMRMTSPLAKILTRTTDFIDRKIKLKQPHTSLEDLKYAIDLASDDNHFPEEQEILKGIVNFGNIPVKSIMRARIDVVALDVETPLNELVDQINDHGYSRMPVFEENLDQIRGVLHIKDLLPLLRDADPETEWQDRIRTAYFVPENKKIDDLFDELKTRRVHMAVVVDEFGGTAGIVTLEDIIEEIFGEIQDEFDSEDWVYTQLTENKYIFQGRISLNDLRKIANLDDEVFEDIRGESDSLGGLLLEIQGRIPKSGEVIRHREFEFHVESASKNRIHMVKLIIHREITHDNQDENDLN